jgi:hypothetical protein
VSCHDQLQAGLGCSVLHPSEVLVSTLQVTSSNHSN